MAQSSSGGIALRYVLLVLWMTSRLAALGRVIVYRFGVVKSSTPCGVARPGRNHWTLKALVRKVSLQLLSELRRVYSGVQICRQVVPRRGTGVAK